MSDWGILARLVPYLSKMRLYVPSAISALSAAASIWSVALSPLRIASPSGEGLRGCPTMTFFPPGAGLKISCRSGVIQTCIHATGQDSLNGVFLIGKDLFVQRSKTGSYARLAQLIGYAVSCIPIGNRHLFAAECKFFGKRAQVFRQHGDHDPGLRVADKVHLLETLRKNGVPGPADICPLRHQCRNL